VVPPAIAEVPPTLVDHDHHFGARRQSDVGRIGIEQWTNFDVPPRAISL